MEENNNQNSVETPVAKKPSKLASLWETVRFVVLALIIVIPIRAYIAQPFVVSGSSMDPTFKNGDYLIIDEISYRFHEPKRDEVIVFRYPNDPKKFFIKRIIGLPGETIDIIDGSVTIHNPTTKIDLKMNEPYVVNHSGGNTHFELKDGEYFVMGDNRPASSDSRYWGAVPRENIVGHAFPRLLPLNKINLNPGKYTQTNE